MLCIGLVGLAVNVASMKLLADESVSSLNGRNAYLEVLSDAISSFGVILGGGIIWMTGCLLIDPLLSAGISIFIVLRTWGRLSQAVHALMEGVPTHLNAKAVGQVMAGMPGVKEICDLHIWPLPQAWTPSVPTWWSQLGRIGTKCWNASNRFYETASESIM